MYSSGSSSVMVLPLIAAIVRFSACRGSKSVEARTISSPTCHWSAFRTSMVLLPASAVAVSLVHVFVRLPCRFSVPPAIKMPRSPMPAIRSSFGLLSVRVMVAFAVWGLASVPISSSPVSVIHSVVSVRSESFEKLSLPSTLTPLKSGGLTSRTTSKPAPIVTMSPACGTFPPDQMDESDHRPSLTASCAWVLKVKKAAASSERSNQRWRKRMKLSPEVSALMFFGLDFGETNTIAQEFAQEKFGDRAHAWRPHSLSDAEALRPRVRARPPREPRASAGIVDYEANERAYHESVGRRRRD